MRIPASGDLTSFTMGRPYWSPGEDGWGNDSDALGHQVLLNAYLIDRYEVTAGDYKNCVDAGQCMTASTGGNCTYDVAGKEQHPINCIDWFMAKKYCEWAGGRLPTEAEWERAAKGPNGHRRFPWGNNCPKSWSAEYCTGGNWNATTPMANCKEADCHDSKTFTSPVGSFLLGRSPEGLYDMAGNVSEWTSDWSMRVYDIDNVSFPKGPDTGTERIIRGGSWLSGGSDLRVVLRDKEYPYQRPPNVGVRCAKTIP